MASERLITIIEFPSRVDHLELAKDRKLIGSERVLVILDELIPLAIGSDGGMNGLNGCVVLSRLGGGGVASSVAREDLHEGDLALRGDVCGDF